MPNCFVIEDKSHAEQISEHQSFGNAWDALRHLATIPWDHEPNVAPCKSWRTCGRDYEIIEYDTSAEPWQELRRVAGLSVSAKGTGWGREEPPRDT
jgi:hypothetical protein